MTTKANNNEHSKHILLDLYEIVNSPITPYPTVPQTIPYGHALLQINFAPSENVHSKLRPNDNS